MGMNVMGGMYLEYARCTLLMVRVPRPDPKQEAAVGELLLDRVCVPFPDELGQHHTNQGTGAANEGRGGDRRQHWAAEFGGRFCLV